jgi:uncharacterized membrane protein
MVKVVTNMSYITVSLIRIESVVNMTYSLPQHYMFCEMRYEIAPMLGLE